MSTKLKVAVGLSGGVDSAVAAALLAAQGHSVIGITMKIWNGAISVQDGAKLACFGPDETEDVAACERLSAKLGIEYRAIDLAAEYEERVLEYFRREYRAGRTPNPCIVCNSELKFGFLIERAQALGLDFDYFATGHYARVERTPGGDSAALGGAALGGAALGGDSAAYRLRSALDPAKDQSYFLYRLGPKLLSKVLFPLGELSKSQVRDTARSLGLEVADKPESQDFIAGKDYSPLFADRPPESGDIVDQTGRVLGRHKGLPYYTIGQRRGLGIGASEGSGAEAEPLYVLGLDAERNRVIVGPNGGLFAEALLASDFKLYVEGTRATAERGMAKFRQNQKPVPCSFLASPDGSCKISFDISQRALAPGQSVVVYDDGGYVLGGGVIERAL